MASDRGDIPVMAMLIVVVGIIGMAIGFSMGFADLDGPANNTTEDAPEGAAASTPTVPPENGTAPEEPAAPPENETAPDERAPSGTR